MLALRDATTRGSVAYDQAELVRAAAVLLVDDPALLAAERTRCRYVYVDELADTDPAQIDLLGLVAGGGAHVVGFADPDSATFAFRGGDPDRGARLHRAVPHRRRATTRRRSPCGTSYRSTAELVAATRRVAARLRGPASHRAIVPPVATAHHVDGRPALEVCTLRSATSESAYVAHRLREAHLHDGVPWSRMAVIVRSLQHHHAALRRALTQAGVPVTTGAEDTALATQPAIAPLLNLLRCALGMSPHWTKERRSSLLHSRARRCRSVPGAATAAGSARDGCGRIGDTRPSGELLVEALLDPGDLATGRAAVGPPGPRHRRPARHGADRGRPARRPRAEDVLWEVWRASGLAERWAARERPRRSARRHRRPRPRRGAGALRRGGPVHRPAAGRPDRGVPRPPARPAVADRHPRPDRRPRARRCGSLTAHAAKGLEWDVVVVAGVQEGVWPDLRLRGSVLGSERLVDLAAGRAVTGRPGGRRRPGGGAARRGAAAVLRGHHPGPAGAAGDRGRPEHHRQRRRGAAEPVPVRAAVRRADRGRRTTRIGGDERGGRRSPRRACCDDRSRCRRSWPSCARPWSTRTNREPVRRAAAGQLARLAAAGVPGADPDEWWGLRELSDAGDLVPAGEQVRVSVHPLWRACCAAGCGGCSSATAAATRPRPSRASATWCTRPRCWPRRRRRADRRGGRTVLCGRSVRPDRAAGPLARPARARPGRRRWSTSC